MRKTYWVRNFTSFFAMLAILTATSAVALAFSDKAKGEIVVSGNSDGNGSYVILDGQKAYNGRTFISSGIIKTEEKAATIKLEGLGSVKLSPNSTMNLNISDSNISGTLSSGQVKVLNKKGVKVNIETPDSNITNDGLQKNVFNLDLSSGTTVAKSEVGTILLNTGAITTAVTAQDDDDDDDTNIIPIVLLFAGIVTIAAIYAFRNNDDNDLQTISAIF